jgi:hypothetical protein
MDPEFIEEVRVFVKALETEAGRTGSNGLDSCGITTARAIGQQRNDQ